MGKRLFVFFIIAVFLCNLIRPDLSVALEDSSFSLQVQLRSNPILDSQELPLHQIEYAFRYIIARYRQTIGDISENIFWPEIIVPNTQLVVLFDEKAPSDVALGDVGKHKFGDNWVVPCLLVDTVSGTCILKYDAIVCPDGRHALIPAPLAGSRGESIRAFLQRRGAAVEEETLSKYATRNSEAVRRSGSSEDELRPPFMRDAQKIIHSRAFSRSDGKTQVVPFPKPHDLTKRMSHIEMVTKVAIAIGRSLGLNEDLIEAICKGHDLGHTPFGHAGEYALSGICEEEGIGYFVHNAQGMRVLLGIEELDLTLQVADGILSHNGEVLSREYKPGPRKTWDQVLEECRRCFSEKGFDRKIRPMTLEGCVMRISDIIAYIGRDLEDAIKTGLVKREDIPKEVIEVLGDTNGEIMDTLITDLVMNSFSKDSLTFSEPVFSALNKLKEFNYRRIYLSEHVKNYFKDLPEAMRALFDVYLEDIKSGNKASAIYRGGYVNHYGRIFPEADPKRMIIDFIAGMTDKFFVDQVKERLPKLYEKYFKDWFTEKPVIYGQPADRMLDPKSLCGFFKTALFSGALSKKTMVLAFDTAVAGAQRKEVSEFIKVFEELKKDPQFKEVLKNVEIVTSTADNMESNIGERLRGLEGDAEVFVFANLASKNTLNGMRLKTNLVYINEEGFPINAYYPILEIITISLAQFADGSTIDKISAILPEINMIKPHFNKEKGMLFFTLIPDAEEINPGELTRRYSELREFLRAA